MAIIEVFIPSNFSNFCGMSVIDAIDDYQSKFVLALVPILAVSIILAIIFNELLSHTLV